MSRLTPAEKLQQLRAEFAAKATSDSGAPSVEIPWRRRSSFLPPSKFSARLTESFSVAVSADGFPLPPDAPGTLVVSARDVDALGADSLVKVTLQIKAPSLPGRNTPGEREKLIAVALAAALENFLRITQQGA